MSKTIDLDTACDLMENDGCIIRVRCQTNNDEVDERLYHYCDEFVGDRYWPDKADTLYYIIKGGFRNIIRSLQVDYKYVTLTVERQGRQYE